VSNRIYITGAQALIATLQAYHVDTIFGIPGVHTLPIYDAIYQASGMRHILARHEQGAGFMAEGYARISGRPGVVCTITGPGVTNVSTAAASAYADSIPLLIISSSLSRTSQGQSRGELHEIKDQLGVMQSLVGWTRAIEHVEEIPEALHEAFQIMQQGRPRGAYLQIPYDILMQSAEMTIPTLETFEPPLPERDLLIEAAAILRGSQHPLIVAGAGVTFSHANAQLLQLAELLQAPVLLASKSHDVLPTQHPLVISTNDDLPPELDAFIATHDAVLVVGSKLGAERTSARRLPFSHRLIHIDIDPQEIGHNYPAQPGIVSDAKVALEALYQIMQNDPQERLSPGAELDNIRTILYRHTENFQGENLKLLAGVQAALEQLPTDTVVVADMTMLGYAAAQCLPRYQARTFIHPSEFCTIGSALPLALGAQVAVPGHTVIALCGDGGFLLNSSELATATQEKLPVIIIIFNDATFTRVKKDQAANYDHRYIATDLISPDFMALASAFHIHSTRVSTPEELNHAIQNAARHPGPTVIEVPILSPQRD
jgi:thiamine pyrophosphate-dependent acetolactate synthase large subunit-like protein